MAKDQAAEISTETYRVQAIDDLYAEREKEQRPRGYDANEVVDPWSFRAKLGRGTIRVSSVEFRILAFLASRPYHAFSRRSIAKAVSTEKQPVFAETLGKYIKSLRRQLGFYGDYIQSVPYIGYRFKA